MSSPLKVGTRLGSYEITGVLSALGVSTVYRARHVATGDEVALKVLPSEVAADEASRLRFMRESRMAGTLVHPDIVRVRDAGESKQGLYIATEYVAGRDLGRFLAQRGPLPLARAVSVLTPVARALDAAHEAGIIHRDVKPSNILVASGDADHADATGLLTDFGFGIAPSQDIRRLTQAGTFVGSIAYAAPEHISGQATDHRVDVYALGCVLCECLTGEPPFPRERLSDVVTAHLSEPPPAVSSRVHGLPLALDPVIARALAKDPAARYSTCLEFMEAVADTLRRPVADALSEPVADALSEPVADALSEPVADMPQPAVPRALVQLDVDWQAHQAALRVQSGGQPLRFYWEGGRWVARQR